MNDNETVQEDEAPEAAAADAEGSGETADSAQAAPQAAQPPSIEELQTALEAAQRDAARAREDFLRAQADMDNLRKRSAREVENAHKYGLERLVGEFLPVKDSMELGIAAAATAEDVASVREGLEMTLKMFDSALDKLGVTEISPAGEKFDPSYHQAMTTEQTEAREPGTVVTVIQKGYLLNDRLMRPALVTVAAAPPAEATQEEGS